MFNPRPTVVLSVSPQSPEPEAISEAADVLRRGGLVAFPTETVYGLGASALDAPAVASIFAAKGRPPNNPLIVHVPDAAAARALTTSWPDAAERLATRFWPGSLTLILPKRPDVPDVVTAGGTTIGIRVPAHPVALALLRAAGLPIAAPSANRSSRVSPTTAAHVLSSLDGRVDLVLDAGATPGGLESTVLDLTTGPPRLLRPGLISVTELKSLVGPVDLPRTLSPEQAEQPLSSPGMLERHYAPRATLLCVADDAEPCILQLTGQGHRVGWLRLARPRTVRAGQGAIDASQVIEIEMQPNVASYSARLYAALHQLDDAGVAYIVVDLPPATDDWLAVHDRLTRATAK